MGFRSVGQSLTTCGFAPAMNYWYRRVALYALPAPEISRLLVRQKRSRAAARSRIWACTPLNLPQSGMKGSSLQRVNRVDPTMSVTCPPCPNCCRAGAVQRNGAMCKEQTLAHAFRMNWKRLYLRAVELEVATGSSVKGVVSAATILEGGWHRLLRQRWGCCAQARATQGSDLLARRRR